MAHNMNPIDRYWLRKVLSVTWWNRQWHPYYLDDGIFLVWNILNDLCPCIISTFQLLTGNCSCDMIGWYLRLVKIFNNVVHFQNCCSADAKEIAIFLFLMTTYVAIRCCSWVSMSLCVWLLAYFTPSLFVTPDYSCSYEVLLLTCRYDPSLTFKLLFTCVWVQLDSYNHCQWLSGRKKIILWNSLIIIDNFL